MRLAPDIGHRLRGGFATPGLFDARLQEVRQRSNCFVLVHVIEGRGVTQCSLQHEVLDALAFQRSNGLQLLMLFRVMSIESLSMALR